MRWKSKEIDFLRIEIPAVQVEPDVAHEHHSALPAAHFERGRNDLVGRGCRGDNYPIGTDTIRKTRHLIQLGPVFGA